MASKLFWFRTQPGIRNASTMIQMSVTADPTTVIVRNELHHGDTCALEIEVVRAKKTQKEPQQIGHEHAPAVTS